MAPLLTDKEEGAKATPLVRKPSLRPAACALGLSVEGLPPDATAIEIAPQQEIRRQERAIVGEISRPTA